MGKIDGPSTFLFSILNSQKKKKKGKS